MASEVRYTAGFSMPHILERARDNTLTLSVYHTGALVAPTSAPDVTLYDGSGNVKATATTSVSASQSLAVFATVDLSPLVFGDDYYISWEVPLADGVTHSFTNDAILVKRALYPVISDTDIYQRVESLTPGPGAISAKTNYQAKIDEAWVMIQLRLIERGNRPSLILSPSALREVHITLSLSLIFEDLATRSNESYGESARRYREAYNAAWNAVSWKASTEEGTSEGSDRVGHRGGVVWLSGRS